MTELHPYVSKRIKNIPELETFVARAKKIVSKNYPHSFWDCKDIFENLIGSDFVADLINYELSRLAKDNMYAVVDSFGDGFFVVQTEEFRLAVQAMESSKKLDANKLARLALDDNVGNRELLYGIPAHQMIGVHGGGSVVIELYKQENPYPIDILDRNKSLVKKEPIEITSSAIGCFKAHEDVINIIEPAETCILFYFMSADLSNIRWAYDPNTLKPIRAIATSMMSSRLQWAADSLVELGCVDAVPALEKLCDHPDHFVRWTAISDLIQLDAETGISLLEKRFLNDDHPHIRKATRKSLEMIKQQTFQ